MAGDEPYLVRNGWTHELVITQPEHAQEFYRKDGKDHMKEKNLNLGDAFGRLLGRSAGVQGGRKWVAIRAHFDPEFSHASSVYMADIFAIEISQWVTKLSQGSAGDPRPTSGFVRSAAEACHFLPFRLIALTAYGDALDPKTYQELVLLNDLHEPLMLDAIFGKWTPYKLFNFLPTEFRARLKKFDQSWERLNDEVLARAREFLQTMYELLYTNIDVTSTVTAFLLLNISANQSFQSKLREEIKVRQNDPAHKLFHYIEQKDTLLHYAVMESLRMSPALWFSLPEKTAIDKIIGGYHIPAGTPTIIDWKRLNTTPGIWGADSEVFRPERFAGISPTAYRYAFLRFGIGSRRCMGQNIAIVMLKMVVIEVLGRYSMTMGSDSGIRNDRFTVTSEGEIEFIPIGE
ncbi:cytochrome P450 [Aspergillus floccosus]